MIQPEHVLRTDRRFNHASLIVVGVRGTGQASRLATTGLLRTLIVALPRGIESPRCLATITLVVERSVLSNNGQNGFRAGTAVGGSGVVTVSRSAINDNGGHGVWILPGIGAVVSENVLHRNSGSGVFADLDPSTKIHVSANVANDNLGPKEDVGCASIGDSRVYFYQNNVLTRGSSCIYQKAPLL